MIVGAFVVGKPDTKLPTIITPVNVRSETSLKSFRPNSDTTLSERKKHRASFRTPGVIVSNIKALAPDQS